MRTRVGERLRNEVEKRAMGKVAGVGKASSLNQGESSRSATCNFCFEASHVWAECHNLCGFRGHFGHLRDEGWEADRADKIAQRMKRRIALSI